ncbi:LuxR C-terminal-related transcriptional regulator [Streptomyces sp. NPDC059679]|uniref:LuxR C-terminal-related transcriptional regulator n=1 Tax=Streptomyces sp. NPDC059679 TaxID=3346903 RepID=UPI0036764086
MTYTRTRHRGIVGRAELLAELQSAGQKSMSAGLICRVVTGEPKVGRTSLLAMACRTTASNAGLTVRIGCARHANRLASALADGLLRLAAEHRRADVDRAAALLRATVRPGNTRLLGQTEDSAPVGFQDLVGALTRDAPLVVALDDVDQAGPDALVLLRRVVRDMAHLPVILIASTRCGEPPFAPIELADLLLGAHTIVLPGLSEQETAALLDARLNRRFDADFVTTCHEVTAGNPFMVGELCDWIRAHESVLRDPAGLRKAGLPSVAEVMMGRASRIDPQARAVAEAIAVAASSGEADPSLVAHLSGNRLEDTLATLDRLVRMRLVTDNDAVALRHPLLAPALLKAMTRMRRNAAHLAAATYLNERHDTAQRVAGHLVASTVPLDTTWSVDAMMTAARSAGTGARDRVRYLERAARAGVDGVRSRVAPELVAAQLELDRKGGLRRGVDMLGRATDPVVRRRLLGLIGATLCEGEPGDDERQVLQAVQSAVAGTEFQDWPHAYRSLIRSLPSASDSAARPVDDVGLSRGPDSARPFHASAAIGALSAHLAGDDPQAALRRAREALQHDLDDLLLHPLALPAALTVLINSGYQEEAALASRHLRIDDVGRLPRWVQAKVQFLQAVGHYSAGDLAAARSLLTGQLEALTGRGGHAYHRLRVCMVGVLANIHLDLGEPDEAQALLCRHHCDGNLLPVWHYADVLLARARLRVKAGDLLGGGDELINIVRRGRPAGLDGPGTICWRMDGATLLDQTGHRDEALRQARRQAEFAERTGSPRERARALRVRGALSSGVEAIRLLTSAVDLLEGTGNDLDMARTAAELGTVLSHLGRDQEAIAALTRSAHLTVGCGVRDLGDRVRLQLVALDRRAPQDVSVQGILSLTPRERQILIDAVQGQANNKIASNRHITRRTVELHLSSAYRKLRISGRDEFGKILGSPGWWELLVGGD